MEKGQHIRLIINGLEGSSVAYEVVCFARELTLHLSAQTEDSTTKDTTDSNGNIWNEYEVVGRSGDIQFGALLAYDTEGSAISGSLEMAHFEDAIKDTPVNWKIAMVSGENNRVIGKTICSGQGKISNLQATGTVKQQATYSGTLNIYGPVIVGTD